MSNTHTGNIQPSLDYEEHARIGGLDGKKTFLFDNAGNQITSFGALATVNVNGAVNANVSLGASAQYIGLVTNTPVGLHTLAPSPNYIGLASVNIGGTLPALSAGAAYAGLVTVDIGTQNTVKLNSNVTLNASPNFVGLVSIQGNVNLNAGTNNIGDVDVASIAAGANYIGLVSVNIGGTLPALSAGAAYAGLMTVDIGSQNTVKLNSNVTLNDSIGKIGFATVHQGTDPWVTRLNSNVTLNSSVNNIGFATVNVANTINANVSLGASAQFIGIVTITNKDRTITGNLTLSDAKTYIGLTTTTLGAGTANIGFATIFQAFPGGATVYSGIISANGNTTVFVAPASNHFFLKDLHISSLGRSEIEIRSGATTLIPFTSLSTTSGFYEYYGEYGKPSRAQADALVIGLNGGATISYAATVRFGV